jgi:prepilin peptidase CpaA
MHYTLAAVLIASLVAAIFDLRSRRIPNAISIALATGGLAFNFFFGWQHGLAALALMALVLVAGTFAFSFKLIGGGDVKLIAAAVGTLAWPLCVPFALFMFLSGGVVALGLAIARGRLRETALNVQGMAMPMLAGAAPARPVDATPMPYALAIFGGAVLLAIVQTVAPHARILL